MTHPTPDDFDQLRGAFDDPVAPAPSFAARLREEIAMEVTKTVAPTDIRRTVEPLRAARQAESVPLTTWYGALATAAVIALVLALVFVTIRGVIAPERGDDQALVPADPTASGSLFGQTSASATPGAIAGPDVTPSAGFAGADASWPISGVADELGDEIVEVPFVVNSETDLTPNLGVVGTTGFTYGDAGLVAFDMTSNTILWTWAGTVPQRLVSDGQIVTFYGQNVPNAEFGLFGLDIATGEQRWLSTDPSSVGDDSSNNGPIIVDGVVYAGFDERIIRAIDAVTGETRWETSLDHEFGSRSFSPNPDGSPATRSFDLHIALVDAELYVFSGGRFLDVLSPGNGVVIRSAESLPELATDAYDWRVFSVVDGVGYVSATQTRIVSYATPINGAFSGDVDEGHLYALDLTSLGVRWEIDLEDESGTVIDVGGPVVAVGSTFQRIDAATGDLAELADVGDAEPATVSGVPVQRTTGVRAWFVMEIDEGITVVELDADGIARTWSLSIEGALIYSDIVADPDGSLRIVTSYSSTYVIPAANAVPESGYEFDEADQVISGGVIGVDGSLPIGPLDMPLSDQMVEMPSPGAPGRDGKSFGFAGDTSFGTDLGESSLIAYDLATNEQRWVVPIVPRGQIVSDGTTAFIDGYDALAGEGGLFAFDLRTGVERWRITTPTESGVIREPMSPIVSRGVVYAGFDGSILRAIDAVKGTVLWEQIVSGSDLTAFASERSMQIVMHGDRLVVLAGAHILATFVAVDGTPITARDLPIEDSSTSNVWLTMVDETAIVMISDMVDVPAATPKLMDSYGYEETVVAIDLVTMKELWSWAPERLVRPAIMVGDRVLIAVGTTIYDVDPATGERTVHVEVPSPYPGGWYFAMMRTDGEHAWFAYGTENTVEVFQIGVNGLDHQWTAATSQTPHVYDLVADRGGIRIVSDPGPDYYIPAAANLNETVLPSSTIASDDGMYVPNATPEGRDSEGAEGEVPGSYRSQPTPAATIVDNIIQPDEPSPTVLPHGTPFAPASEPTPVASPVDAFPILPNEPDASPEA